MRGTPWVRGQRFPDLSLCGSAPVEGGFADALQHGGLTAGRVSMTTATHGPGTALTAISASELSPCADPWVSPVLRERLSAVYSSLPDRGVKRVTSAEIIRALGSGSAKQKPAEEVRRRTFAEITRPRRRLFLFPGRCRGCIPGPSVPRARAHAAHVRRVPAPPIHRSSGRGRRNRPCAARRGARLGFSSVRAPLRYGTMPRAVSRPAATR